MSDLLGGFDPQGMAEKFAFYDIESLQKQLKTQKTSLAGQQEALKKLRKSLGDFRSAINALNKTNNGILQNKTTVSKEGFLDVKANSSAAKGTYNIFVESTARAHQVAYEDLTDEKVKNARGTLKLSMGGDEISIDLSKLESLGDLADAINSSAGNPGITGSLVRADGKITLMISSDKTGEKNEIKIDSQGSGLEMGKEVVISKAQDAVVWLGEKGTGLKQTSSSNSFDNLIKGVTVDLTQAQKSDDSPLVVNISSDTSATQEQAQKFVDTYNDLKSALAELTKSGSDGKNRGAFAGDSSIMALDRQLNSLLRESIGGLTLDSVGISADKDGKLKLDNEKLEKAIKEDPQVLNTFFNGNDGLIKKMDKSLDAYLNSGKGLLKQRQDSLDRKESQLSAREKTIETRYNNAYNRYLREFSQLQQVMSQMNNTMGMFGLA